MKKNKKYELIIVILAAVAVIETISLFALWQTRPKKPSIKKPRPVLKGKIAIVIDDFGYNLNNLDILKEIKYPLTASVLPNLTYSKEISDSLHSLGFEIIVHLPMEPYENFSLEKETIKTSMDEKQIINIVDNSLSAVPYAVGVSNHMGSKATSDARVMRIVSKHLKRKGLYFLDSFVTPKSVCTETAKNIGVGFAKRDVFLDNNAAPEYIRGQLNKLKAKARLKGKAIGIGHDRKTTLLVIKKIMPEFSKEGYQFVFVSDIINNRD